MSTKSDVRMGRPLDPGIDEAVFTEVLRLIEVEGLAAVSRRRVASGAGVSRQTLYNRWPTAGDMVLDALVSRAERTVGASAADGDLRAYLQDLAAAINRWAAPGLRAVVALAQSDPEFARRFREHLLARRHGTLTERVRIAVGERATDAEVRLRAELIAGSMWYRLLVADLPLDESWVGDMVEVVTGPEAPAKERS